MMLFVHGIPRPQPRPRMAKTGHVYTPASSKAWKTAVKTAFLLSRKPVMQKGAVSLSVIFYMPGPESTTPSFHTARPDLDNLLKSTMDALTEAGTWQDDSQVAHINALKRYAPDKHRAFRDKRKAVKDFYERQRDRDTACSKNITYEWSYGLEENEIEEYGAEGLIRRYTVPNPYYVKTKQERLDEIMQEYCCNGGRRKLLYDMGKIDRCPGGIDPRSLPVMLDVFSLPGFDG